MVWQLTARSSGREKAYLNYHKPIYIYKTFKIDNSHTESLGIVKTAPKFAQIVRWRERLFFAAIWMTVGIEELSLMSVVDIYC